MVSNKKVSGRAMSMPAGICAGVITSVILTLLGAVAVALLLNGQYIEQNQIGYGSMVTLLLASAIGAWFACVRIKHRYLMVCLISGVGYYAALLAISALFFGGQYQGMGVTLLVILAGSVSVGLIRARPRKTITKGYRKLRTG